MTETGVSQPDCATDRWSRAGGPVARWRTHCGSLDLFEGRLAEAAAWYRRAADTAAGDRAEHLLAASRRSWPSAYAGDVRAEDADGGRC